MVHVPEDKIVEGGMLCHLAQRDWMMRDILDLMLSDSDNTATNFLIDFIGFAKMAAWFEAEFAHLHLGRYLMEVTDREIRYILFWTASHFYHYCDKIKADLSKVGI
ncbi:serine hydrolase [Lactobacillus delbrueckii]|uniref:serine hydrolase n=1 Tax=Lactobacillus delbrueckii TaxID=1584 RepID=UPI0022EBA520|nr:serine hydrolase [Lactobacillus delbrueckii]MDA3796750.1 serine hydrolase [Lactobacillus delbrueckii]MDM7512834.1 serine hydrolase [Lactobacillus delbrueckii]WKZ98063.1 class A beta-lactamase-related serine hydrolase [Lactobacillus delbrueckii]